MWLHVPRTSLASAPAREDLTSESTPLSSTLADVLAPSVSWNESLRQPRFWQRVCETAIWTTLLSGLTCDPSTAARGVELWTASLRESPASRTASPASGRAPTTSETSGPRRPGSSPPSGPDGSSWRTLPGFSDTTSIASDRSYRAWVTSLRKRSSRRRKLARHTSGSGSSRWPTAQAQDAQGPRTPEQIAAMRDKTHAGVSNLNAAASVWPSLTSHDGRRPGSDATSTQGANLKRDAESWASPAARSVKGGYSEEALTRQDGKSRMDLLDNQAIYWQTPGADSFRSRGGERKDEQGLDQQARLWPTPKASDDADTAKGTSASLTDAMRSFRPDPETSAPGEPSSTPAPTSRRQLNPVFVEWLMGWRPGWTSLARSDSGSPETASYRCRLHTALSYLLERLGLSWSG